MTVTGITSGQKDIFIYYGHYGTVMRLNPEPHGSIFIRLATKEL
jgi:hypothetical protein